jgi:hypothetical protein
VLPSAREIVHIARPYCRAECKLHAPLGQEFGVAQARNLLVALRNLLVAISPFATYRFFMHVDKFKSASMFPTAQNDPREGLADRLRLREVVAKWRLSHPTALKYRRRIASLATKLGIPEPKSLNRRIPP